MEAQVLELVEVTPAIIKVSQPIVDDTFNHGTEIQLVPKGIELNSEVDVLQ